MNNKTDKSPRNKKICNISLTSSEKDKIILIDNKTFSFNNKATKTIPLIETPGKCNSPNYNEFDDGKNKSMLKMMKMNRCCSSDRFNENILKLEEMSPLQYLSALRLEKNTKSKVEVNYCTLETLDYLTFSRKHVNPKYAVHAKVILRKVRFSNIASLPNNCT